MDVQIRAATEADAEALSTLFVEVNDRHADAHPDLFRRVPAGDVATAFVRDQIARADTCLFVAERAGTLIGFITVRLYEAPDVPFLAPRRYAQIDSMGVHEPFRRHGIGRALVERAHRWAADQGIGAVELVVYEFNAEAIALYEQLGYASVRRTMRRSLRD